MYGLRGNGGVYTKRVTYWDDEYGCWSYHCSSGDAANLLAAYENTGLEPEEIKELCSDDVEEVLNMIHKIIENGEINHLQELLTAEKDGRLVVLPCKKGDTDYTGLVKELRALSKHVPEQMCDDNGIDPLEKAADAIETLLAEMTDYISREMVKQVIDKAIEQADSLQRLPLIEVSAVISNLPTALKKDG